MPCFSTAHIQPCIHGSSFDTLHGQPHYTTLHLTTLTTLAPSTSHVLRAQETNLTAQPNPMHQVSNNLHVAVSLCRHNIQILHPSVFMAALRLASRWGILPCPPSYRLR